MRGAPEIIENMQPLMNILSKRSPNSPFKADSIYKNSSQG